MIEIWGGVECTVNRVENVYRDQVRATGHHDRLGDLDLIADLGIKTLRYPVLWERIAPSGLHNADWSWTDERLRRLRSLDIVPIVTLCHHGSGPFETHLLDSGFAQGLAQFAGAVARRYPWVTHFTPVNEPLTTARFAGLYGHWYPHARSERAFLTALVNQLKATVWSMAEIRKVTPRAQLIQTEDFAAVYATQPLRHQAEHENERRWLSLDLLTGQFKRNGALKGYQSRNSIHSKEIEFFERNVCSPDIVGLNYYVTSERLLDHRIDRYPSCFHGGNGRERYADIEAARALAGGLAGHLGALRVTAERFSLPIALTEVHLGGVPEEQLRWFNEALLAAERVHAEGVDVRAVTAWSLFGACNWNSLVCREEGYYEPGVFDVRGPAPQPTALHSFVRNAALGRARRHSALNSPGWWRSEARFLYEPVTISNEFFASSLSVKRVSKAGSATTV